MTEQHTCPICNSEITPHASYTTDYYCKANNDHHFYAKRIKDGVLTKVKIRFTDTEEKLYIKFDYILDKFEVWALKLNKDIDAFPDRISINGAFVPDYTDVDKLKQKIKTYLLFS